MNTNNCNENQYNYNNNSLLVILLLLILFECDKTKQKCEAISKALQEEHTFKKDIERITNDSKMDPNEVKNKRIKTNIEKAKIKMLIKELESSTEPSIYLEQVKEENIEPLNGVEEENIEPLKEVKEQNIEPLEEVKDQSIEPLEEIKEQNIEPLQEVQDQSIEPLEEVKDQSIEPLEEVKDQSIEPLEEVKEQSIEPLEEVKEQSIEPLEEVKEQSIEPLEEIKEQSIEPLEEVKEQSIEPFEEIKEQSIQPLEEVEKQGIESLEEIKEQSIEPLEEIKEQSIEPLEEIKEQSIEPLEEKPEELENENLKASDKKNLEKIRNSVKNFRGDAIRPMEIILKQLVGENVVVSTAAKSNRFVDNATLLSVKDGIVHLDTSYSILSIPISEIVGVESNLINSIELLPLVETSMGELTEYEDCPLKKLFSTMIGEQISIETTGSGSFNYINDKTVTNVGQGIVVLDNTMAISLYKIILVERR